MDLSSLFSDIESLPWGKIAQAIPAGLGAAELYRNASDTRGLQQAQQAAEQGAMQRAASAGLGRSTALDSNLASIDLAGSIARNKQRNAAMNEALGLIGKMSGSLFGTPETSGDNGVNLSAPPLPTASTTSSLPAPSAGQAATHDAGLPTGEVSATNPDNVPAPPPLLAAPGRADASKPSGTDEVLSIASKAIPIITSLASLL